MTRAKLVSLLAGALLLASAGLPVAAWAGHGHGHGHGHGYGQGHGQALGYGRGYERGHAPARGIRHRAARPAHHRPRHDRYRPPVVVIHAPPPPRLVRHERYGYGHRHGHRHGRGCGHPVVVAPRHYAPRVAVGVHYDGFYFGWNGGY